MPIFEFLPMRSTPDLKMSRSLSHAPRLQSRPAPLKPILKRSKSLENKQKLAAPAAPAPQSTPKRPRSLSFKQKIEFVCVFDGQESPLDILTSPRYAVHDSGDLNAATASSSPGSSPVEIISAYSFSDGLASSDMFKTVQQWGIARRNSGERTYMHSSLNVVLQSLSIAGTDRLVGEVAVRNLAFHKSVSIRYTVDGWSSHTDHGLSFKSSASQSFGEYVGIDIFQFELDLAALSSSSPVNLEFVVKYEVNGTTYWDNNFGANHRCVLDQRPVMSFQAPSLTSLPHIDEACESPRSPTSPISAWTPAADWSDYSFTEKHRISPTTPVIPVLPPSPITSSTERPLLMDVPNAQLSPSLARKVVLSKPASSAATLTTADRVIVSPPCTPRASYALSV
ncbi:putative phosphatase regulatory subunit-domain-containing protein [Polychytrium aggregatum]|uniref:putative phosphatase regulatory subunit-domain-containing protein n=1 Tax=Polychytrium aggregatum TaxID=110093 RepID=UPI0022FE5702|nr:putative phosphatase regulatory subunit-domain-containing protein [Polychytrium aggregatum]KAI9206435.1 putative phosphatase regulatory subunit-domain-containing protein [Polychytrium aggregatum]